MDIAVFNYQSKEIRTVVDENGEPWWVGKDVCRVLGYSDHIKALGTHLKEKHKRGWQIATPLGGNQTLTCITESGLYRLILRCQLNEAEKFQDWVEEEVLPCIRKTGSYSMKTPITQRVALHQAAAIIVEAWLNSSRLLGTSLQMGRVVAVKKANEETTIDFSPLLTDNTVPEKPMTPTDLAKIQGISAVKMNKLLEEGEFQTRIGDAWVATEKGRAFSTLDPYQSKNSNHTGYRLMWDPSVLKELKQKAIHVPS